MWFVVILNEGENVGWWDLMWNNMEVYYVCFVLFFGNGCRIYF